jgi:hypothetical protein
MNTQPVDRTVTTVVVASLALTLVSSVLYTLQGWDDPLAALLHILGGALGGVLVVRLASWSERSWLAAAVLVIGMLGAAGVVGYGFNTVEVGLGGVDLIDATGVAVVLKPLGLCWPLALLLAGIGLWLGPTDRGVPRWCAIGIVAGALAFPVSRIANIGWLAILVDLILLGCLVAVPPADGEAVPMGLLRGRRGSAGPSHGMPY